MRDLMYSAVDWLCTAKYTPAQFLIVAFSFAFIHVAVSAYIHKWPLVTVDYDDGRVVVDYTLRGKVVHGEAVHNH